MLKWFGLVSELREASWEQISDAMRWMKSRQQDDITNVGGVCFPCDGDIPHWSIDELEDRLKRGTLRKWLLIDGYIVDVSNYLKLHVCRPTLAFEY